MTSREGFKTMQAKLVATVTALLMGAAAPVNSSAAAVQKLEANAAFPYTQVSIRMPHLSGAGVQAREARVLTGLDVVVSVQRPSAHGKPALAGISVSYLGQQLGQARYVGKDLYLMLDISKWPTLPVGWTAATDKQLGELNLAFGERWFEVPSALIAKATAKGPSVAKDLKSPSDLSGAFTNAVAKLVRGMALSEAKLPGGNELFSGQGSLSSLGAVLAQLRNTPGFSVKSAKGTYRITMTTAAAGRYMATIDVAVSTPQGQSTAVDVAFAHSVVPVVTPANATVVTPSMLASVGL